MGSGSNAENAPTRKLRPQSMLFTLWGDYVIHRGGIIGSRSLISIGEQFGLSEPALRSSLARMSRAGWLQRQRSGRRSFYSLSPAGRHLLNQGTRRIFRRPRDSWDGRWHIVGYSVPEEQRGLRDALRKRLSYLGFGQLPSGTWISPHDLRSEVDELVVELGAETHVEHFRGAYAGPLDDRALASRAWDLQTLAHAYQGFISRWLPLSSRLESGVTLEPPRAFVQRFLVIHEYRRFFFTDPDLPSLLLHPQWPASRAAELFESVHERLTGPAEAFFTAAYLDGHQFAADASLRARSGARPATTSGDRAPDNQQPEHLGRSGQSPA